MGVRASRHVLRLVRFEMACDTRKRVSIAEGTPRACSRILWLVLPPRPINRHGRAHGTEKTKHAVRPVVVTHRPALRLDRVT